MRAYVCVCGGGGCMVCGGAGMSDYRKEVVGHKTKAILFSVKIARQKNLDFIQWEIKSHWHGKSLQAC